VEDPGIDELERTKTGAASPGAEPGKGRLWENVRWPEVKKRYSPTSLDLLSRRIRIQPTTVNSNDLGTARQNTDPEATGQPWKSNIGDGAGMVPRHACSPAPSRAAATAQPSWSS
jgi:hypothetical protein